MTADVSSIGITAVLTASITYPNGISFTAFPEEGDIGAAGTNEIAGNASGVNGELIVYKTVNPIEVTLPLIPNTEEESLMDLLFEANRASKNRFPKKDIITLVLTNPVTGVAKTYKNGVIKSGTVAYQYGADSRIKNKTYTFVFEDAV